MNSTVAVKNLKLQWVFRSRSILTESIIIVVSVKTYCVNNYKKSSENIHACQKLIRRETNVFLTKFQTNTNKK